MAIMRTSNFWLPLIAFASMLASPLHAATIENFGIAPNNPLPGDLVTAFFEWTAARPLARQAFGSTASSNENGFYSYTFSVPHGGRFNYELRFRDPVGALTVSTQGSCCSNYPPSRWHAGQFVCEQF